MKKIVYVGNIPIGQGNIVIQSMTNTKTSNIIETVNQINDLVESGCELVRIAVKDMDDALSISKIKSLIKCPLIADIHFDYKLAIESIRQGIDKIRINPGNMPIEHLTAITNECKINNTPIRIGVNSGSLSKDLIEKYGVSSKALIEEMKREIKVFEKLNYKNLVLSIKATDINMFIDANRKLAKLYDYPIHIGLTESGTLLTGSIRSSYALGTLLNENIGDTIRVSLTGNPLNEIKSAKEILKMFNKYNGPTLISCPTCGRCEYDMVNIISKIEPLLDKINKPIKVAIMGCIVNGIGEGKEADLGIAGGKNQAVIFRKGEIIQKVNEENIIEEFTKILNEYK